MITIATDLFFKLMLVHHVLEVSNLLAPVVVFTELLKYQHLYLELTFAEVVSSEIVDANGGINSDIQGDGNVVIVA